MSSGSGGTYPNSAFFGRDREHSVLRKELERGAGIVEVVGHRGSGKTAFLKHFEQTTSLEFPGGVEWFAGSQDFQLSEAIDAIVDGFRRTPGQHLLIIDDADRLDPGDLIETVNRLGTGPWSFSTVLGTHQPLSHGPVITLGGLDVEDFASYMRFLFGDAMRPGICQNQKSSKYSKFYVNIYQY